MFGKQIDLEAQPRSSVKQQPPPQQQQHRLMIPTAASSFKHLLEKNNTNPSNYNGRSVIRWRRLRPVAFREVTRMRKLVSSKSTTTSAAGALASSALENDNHHHHHHHHHHYSSGTSLLASVAAFQENNPMHFLQQVCPPDVLPLVLAFAGPQQAAALQRTNRHWKQILDQEMTWKVMCQELYKWKEGDPRPSSWKEFYRLSPCVPVDYPTVEAALKFASPRPSTSPLRRPTTIRQVRSVRILLRPGTYHLTEGIHIHAPPGISVSLESIQLPPTCRWYRTTSPPTVKEQLPERALPPRSTSRSLLQMFRCSSRASLLGDAPLEEPTENSSESEGSNGVVEEEYPLIPLIPPKRAKLILRSRRNNEPMVRVRQGQLYMKDLDLEHTCLGLDIWNGNAAIQIQPPPLEEDQEPQPLPECLRPRASLSHCRVKSKSGRGVVNIDGGHVDVDSCFIAGCAATGLYVGGPGSSGHVQSTDVYGNGRGNPRRRGIARGHSGVYLEQGHATLQNCLVAANTLTGISAVSHEKAILTLTDSTVTQNGTNQMELPPLGTVARSKCVLERNELEPYARLQSRSGLWQAL